MTDTLSRPSVFPRRAGHRPTPKPVSPTVPPVTTVTPPPATVTVLAAAEVTVEVTALIAAAAALQADMSALNSIHQLKDLPTDARVAAQNAEAAALKAHTATVAAANAAAAWIKANNPPPVTPPVAPPVVVPPVITPPISPPVTIPTGSPTMNSLIAAVNSLGYKTKVFEKDWTAAGAAFGPEFIEGEESAPGGGLWPNNSNVGSVGIDTEANGSNLSFDAEGAELASDITSESAATSSAICSWGQGSAVAVGTPQSCAAIMQYPSSDQGEWDAFWGLPAQNAMAGKTGGAESEVDWNESGSVAEGDSLEVINSTICSTYHGATQADASSGFQKNIRYAAGFDLTKQLFIGGWNHVPGSHIDYWVVKPGDTTPTIFFTVTEAETPIDADPHEILFNCQVAAQGDSSWHTVPKGPFPIRSKMTVAAVVMFTP